MNKKRYALIISAILAVILAMCLFVACDDKNDSNTGTAQIGFFDGTGGSVDGKTLSLEVGETVSTIDLIDVIYAKNGATYTVSEDEDGKLIVPDKKINVSNGENKFYVIAKLGKDTVTYTLNIWKNHKVLIQYYVNGELYDSERVMSHTYLGDHSAPEDLQYGMEFLGWDCKDHYVEESKTFHAKLKYAKISNITLDANGGTCESQSIKVGYGEKLKKLPVPTKTGYKFQMWIYNSTPIADRYGDVLTGNWTINSDVTLVALWVAQSVSVSFISNDVNVCSGWTAEYTYGQKCTVDDGKLKKLGYRFLGWYKDGQKVGDGYEFEFTPTPENNIYELKWEYDKNLDIFDYRFDSLYGITITGVKDRSLTSLTVPCGIYSIAGGAFAGMSALQELTLPLISGRTLGAMFGENEYANSVAVIQKYTHEYSFSDTYYIPQSLRKVTLSFYETYNFGDGVFENCTMLKEVVLDGHITQIEDYMFNGCTALESVTMSDKVESIGVNAFAGCGALVDIEFSGNITSVAGNALEDTAWYNSQPGGLIYIGKTAYKYKGVMPDDTYTVLKSDTVAISDYAFSDCDKCVILIPSSVKVIGKDAFGNCLVGAVCEADVKPNDWHSDWLGTNAESECSFNSAVYNQLLKEIESETA